MRGQQMETNVCCGMKPLIRLVSGGGDEISINLTFCGPSMRSVQDVCPGPVLRHITPLLLMSINVYNTTTSSLRFNLVTVH